MSGRSNRVCAPRMPVLSARKASPGIAWYGEMQGLWSRGGLRWEWSEDPGRGQGDLDMLLVMQDKGSEGKVGLLFGESSRRRVDMPLHCRS